MLGSAILETLIGLVLIFLLLSLVCSAVNEAFAALLRRRGSMLKKAIGRLLDGAEPTEATERFYEHPMVDVLRKNPRGLPSYISSSLFSEVVLDMVAPGDGATPATERVAAIERAVRDPSSESNGILRLADNPRLASILRPLIQRAIEEAGDDVEARLSALRNELEAWYDRTMERTSGWYKRHTQLWLTLIALGLTVLLNADTLTIARHLYSSPATRQALTQAAMQYVADDEISTLPPGEQAALLKELVNMDSLPLGWAGERARWADLSWPEYAARKASGWLLMVFAVAMGAPFWFQLLSRLVSLRAAGANPEKDKSEKRAKD